MGSVVFALPVVLLAASAVFGAASAAIFAAVLEKRPAAADTEPKGENGGAAGEAAR
jgi:hypothetical protein